MTFTRTRTRYWSEKEMMDLDLAITHLTASLERRRAAISQEVIDQMESRIRILNAAWYLCGEGPD